MADSNNDSLNDNEKTEKLEGLNGHVEAGQKDDIEVLSATVNDESPGEVKGAMTTFPEGGFWAWSAIVGGFLVQFCGLGYVNTFGVYQDFYIRRYLTNETPSNIGWIGGVQIALTLGVGAVTGRIFDRGYSTHLLISSTILYAVCLFMLSLAHENSYYQIFLAHGLGLGLAIGMTYTPSLALPGHYFREKRPLVMSIVSSGTAIGSVIHPILLNKLINGHVGFANGVRISAAMNVVLLMVAACLMRPRLPPKVNQTFPVMKWVREPIYASVLAGSAFFFLGLFFPPFYLQLYSIQHGVSTHSAFYALSILNTASFFGRTIPGFIAPSFGVFNLATFFTISTGIVVFCMVAVKNATGTVLFAIFYGLLSGPAIGLTPSFVACTAKDMNEVGTRMGIYFGVGGLMGLFATPISGAFLTSHYHWARPIVFSATMMIVAGVFFGISRMFYARSRGTHIV